jgi:hypothetical protein
MEDSLTSLFGVPLGLAGAAATGPQADNSDYIPAGSTHAVPSPGETHYVEHSSKHKGVAGVARDILGTLGDFLLTRLHMPAMYGPAQQQRKLEAAIQGFDQDPIGAIDRVTDVDYVAGTKLRDQFIDNQRMAAQQASTQEAREARLALAKQAADERTRGRAGAMLGTMANWAEDKRPSSYSALRDQVLRYGKVNGLDLSNELPETYDPVALDSFIDTSVPVGTQRAQRLSEANNVRNNETSRENNIRSTDTSRDNNVRTTNTSRENNVRTNQTSEGNNARTNTTRAEVSSANRGERAREANQHDKTLRRGQDLRPHQPVEGERRTIGGKTYVWHNGKAVQE